MIDTQVHNTNFVHIGINSKCIETHVNIQKHPVNLWNLDSEIQQCIHWIHLFHAVKVRNVSFCT